MSRRPLVAALALATSIVTAVALGSTGAALAGAPPGQPLSHPAPDRGTPGTWTKVSSGTVAIQDQPSLVRTADGNLHLVYTAASSSVIRHSTIHSNGALGVRDDVLGTPWNQVVPDPVVITDGGDDLQVLFGGIQGDGNPLYDAGRMYAASSVSGGGWALDAEAAGQSLEGHSQDGTAATSQGAVQPFTGFALNNTLVWHVGQGPEADVTYSPGASPDFALSHATFVSSGSDVWAGWLQQGPTAATTGFFAMQVFPTVGTPLKAPGSSVGTQTVTWLTRTPLAARAGGGIFEAYCVGAPNCSKVRLWKVGTTKTVDAPHSRFASIISLSAAPSGRLWLAWADNLPKVRAVRTGTTGLVLGAVQNAGLPRGGAAHSLAIEGTLGRGDIVLNAGNGMWHTQVLPGLSLKASPSHWRHGSRQKVVFTVTDARAAVRGARVKVGALHCTTRGTGTCSITFPASFGKGKHAAVAARSGFAKASSRLRVG